MGLKSRFSTKSRARQVWYGAKCQQEASLSRRKQEHSDTYYGFVGFMTLVVIVGSFLWLVLG